MIRRVNVSYVYAEIKKKHQRARAAVAKPKNLEHQIASQAREAAYGSVLKLLRSIQPHGGGRGR